MFGQHSHYGVTHVAQLDRLADDLPVSAKCSSPHRIPEHHDGRRPCLSSSGKNSRPSTGCTPNNARNPADTCFPCKCCDAPAPVRSIVRCETPPSARTTSPEPSSPHSSRTTPTLRELRRTSPTKSPLVPVLVGQRLQQNRVHHAENRRISANPQRQRQHRNPGEHRRLRQHSHGVPQILPKVFITPSRPTPPCARFRWPTPGGQLQVANSRRSVSPGLKRSDTPIPPTNGQNSKPFPTPIAF